MPFENKIFNISVTVALCSLSLSLSLLFPRPRSTSLLFALHSLLFMSIQGIHFHYFNTKSEGKGKWGESVNSLSMLIVGIHQLNCFLNIVSTLNWLVLKRSLHVRYKTKMSLYRLV